jgi:hypothetical protein
MSGVAIPTFVQMLTALAKILDKAAAHCTAKKIDPSVLLNMRLFPDMLSFTKQVQLASDFAKNGVARPAGVEAPKFPDEEKSFDELKARIAKTIDFVNGVKPAQLDGSEGKDITFPVGPQSMTLKGEAYLIHFALPNFYFHTTTAYNILRHCGVEIGKRDFLGRV